MTKIDHLSVKPLKSLMFHDLAHDSDFSKRLRSANRGQPRPHMEERVTLLRSGLVLRDLRTEPLTLGKLNITDCRART